MNNGLVQKASFSGNRDEPSHTANEGGGFMSTANQVEGFDGLRSTLARLKFAEPEQGEPVRVGLTGHELARAPALTLGPAAAHEAAVIQEEAQQPEVRRAQMAA